MAVVRPTHHELNPILLYICYKHEGLFCSVFILSQGSWVFENPKAVSKRSLHQVKVGLDLLNGSVQDLHIDPKEVAVIAPYAANVKLVDSMRRNYTSLQALTNTATIDSFQDQESSIALVVTGTAHPRPGT